MFFFLNITAAGAVDRELLFFNIRFLFFVFWCFIFGLFFLLVELVLFLVIDAGLIVLGDCPIFPVGSRLLPDCRRPAKIIPRLLSGFSWVETPICICIHIYICPRAQRPSCAICEGCAQTSEDGCKTDYIYMLSRYLRILESSWLSSIFRCSCKVRANMF